MAQPEAQGKGGDSSIWPQNGLKGGATYMPATQWTTPSARLQAPCFIGNTGEGPAPSDPNSFLNTGGTQPPMWGPTPVGNSNRPQEPGKLFSEKVAFSKESI